MSGEERPGGVSLRPVSYSPAPSRPPLVPNPSSGERMIETPAQAHPAVYRRRGRSNVVYDSARHPMSFLEEIPETWAYPDLLGQLVSRATKSRHKASAWGIAWTLVTPLMMMVVLTLVFSSVFRQWEVHHYPVYLLSAMVLWNFFTQSTTAAMSQLLWGGALLGKIYVPK